MWKDYSVCNSEVSKLYINIILKPVELKKSDEEHLRSTLGLHFLIKRRKKHLLQMMYNQKIQSPEPLNVRNKGIVKQFKC